MTGSLPWVDAGTVARILPMADAVTALENALLTGLDPASDPPRGVVDVRHGQLLLMPSEAGEAVGVKLAFVAPDNPSRGLARIQGLYVLCDAQTLTPTALLDGTAITSLRTPALSGVAVRHLAADDASRLVVFGSGPQARGHVDAVRAVRPITQVVVVGRDPARAQRFAEEVSRSGLPASVGVPEAVSDADVVVCATTASEPLFPADLVPNTACVVAVGSHEPHRRELDSALMGRAGVVVEDAGTALREAGDVVLAVDEGALDPASLLTLAGVVVRGIEPDPGRPRVFKSVGMSWEDLVVAAEVQRRSVGGSRR